MMRRIQSDSSANEPAWAPVDEELGKLVEFLKVDVNMSSSPDIETALAFCASHGTKTRLRVSGSLIGLCSYSFGDTDSVMSTLQQGNRFNPTRDSPKVTELTP